MVLLVRKLLSLHHDLVMFWGGRHHLLIILLLIVHGVVFIEKGAISASIAVVELALVLLLTTLVLNTVCVWWYASVMATPHRYLGHGHRRSCIRLYPQMMLILHLLVVYGWCCHVLLSWKTIRLIVIGILMLLRVLIKMGFFNNGIQLRSPLV